MERKISEFLNKEYKDFSKYVLENRAIPNIIDGFKPVHRKILYTALKHCKSKHLKTVALVGYVLAESNYVHGDSSVEGAINKLTQDFTGANNIEMFAGKGNFGNRMIKQPAAGRYTGVKLSEKFLSYFSFDGLEDDNFDPENPEPRSYLPTIPWLLVNGIEGIAIGFSTKILPRDPDNLKKIMLNKLKDKPISISLSKPYYKGYQGNIVYDEIRNKWVMYGKYEEVSHNKIKITEVPISFDREKYIIFLNSLVEKKAIHSYEDNLTDKWNITVKMYEKITGKSLYGKFRLVMDLNENITVMDMDNNLRIFDFVEDVIDYFLQYRLKKLKQKIKLDIKKCLMKIDVIDEMYKFSKLVKTINLHEIRRMELLSQLREKGYKYGKYLIEQAVYKYSKDEIEKKLKEKENEIKNLEYLRATTSENELIKMLKRV